MMKKIIVALIILLAGMFMFASLDVSAEDVPVPEDEIVEIDEELNAQLKTIENIVIAVVVSFLGSSAFGVIAWKIITKATEALKDKVRIAEEQNQMSNETATKINKRLQDFEMMTLEEIKELQETFSATNQNLELLISMYKTRDEKLGVLLEESLGD